MASGLKIRYLRLVRRSFRLLRNPRIRRYPWLIRLLAPIFDRQLWHPCRENVATGLAIGLFMAMLPIPGQMILAAITAMKFRGNVVIAIAACWVTNPVTQIPIAFFQERFGTLLRQSLHIPVHPVLDKGQIPLDIFPGMAGKFLNAPNFILGFLSLAFILALLAFPLVYLLAAIMPKILPKSRFRKARSKVLARQKKRELTPRSSPCPPPDETPK